MWVLTGLSSYCECAGMRDVRTDGSHRFFRRTPHFAQPVNLGADDVCGLGACYCWTSRLFEPGDLEPCSMSEIVTDRAPGVRQRIAEFVESSRLQRVIIALLLIYPLTLGLETFPC